MAINKVKYGNNTLIDLTGTTATSDKILTGYGAFGRDGVWMDGSLVPGADDGYVYQDQDNYVVLDDDEGVGVGVTPLNVTSNGTYNAGTRRAYNPVTVNVQPSLQSKSVTPTESQQTITPDSGKYGLSQVVVAGIDAGYVGSGVPRKSSSDLTVSGATVTVPAGYYSGQATKSVASMTLPTATATTSVGTLKSTIARSTATRYINIPTGYNSASGTYKIESVPNGTATTPATTITTNPTISVNSSGLITATNSKTQSVTPTVSAGYVSTGTAGTITVSGSATSQLTTKGATTYTPTTTNQTIASGTYLTGAQTIAGDANLVASNIKSGVTIFGVEGTAQSEPNLRTAEVTPTEETQVIIGDLDTDTLVASSALGYSRPTFSADAQALLINKITVGAGNFDETTVFPVKYRFQFAIDKHKGSSSGPYIYNTIKINTVVTFTGLGGLNEVIGEISVSDAVINKLVITRGSLVNNFYIYVVFNSTNSESLSYVDVNPSSTIQPLRVYRVDTTEYDGLSQVTVNPIPSTYIVPKYTYTISKNGLYDIRSYASVRAMITELSPRVTVTKGITGTAVTADGYMQYNGSTYTLASGNTFYYNYGDEIYFHAPQMGQQDYAYGNIYLNNSFVRSTQYTYTTPSTGAGLNVEKSGYDMYIGTAETSADAYATQMISRIFSNNTFVLPDTISYIGSYAFYSAGYLSYVTGNYVTKMSMQRFAYTPLLSVSFPLLQSIESMAFYYCSKLQYFDGPNITRGSMSIFYSCSALSYVNIPLLTDGSGYMFANCINLTSVNMPRLTSIGSMMFYNNTRLPSVSFPSCTSVGSAAFRYCSALSQIYMPKLTNIQQSAFYGTALSEVSFESINNMRSYAFAHCSNLSNVQIGSSGIFTVGIGAFMSCSALSYIRLSTCSVVAGSAFLNCWNLNTVILDTVASINGSAFSNCYNLLSLYLFRSMGTVSLVFDASQIFANTPIMGRTDSTGGVYGSIFVKESYYSAYLSNSRWAAISDRLVSLTDAQISAILNS